MIPWRNAASPYARTKKRSRLVWQRLTTIMTEKRTSSYERRFKGKNGFSLAELLVVVAIITALAAISIPSFFRLVRNAKEKAYISETYLVRMALQAYLTEKSVYGKLPDKVLYEDIIFPNIDEPENALYPMLRGSCTKGGSITCVGYYMETFRLNDIVYEVDGYEIEILDDHKVRVKKIDG